MVATPSSYIGRLAPSPTGYLHLGHARTFWLAAERARLAGGRLLMRIDDLDFDRCKPVYTEAALDDLAWLGLKWETPVITQSERVGYYRSVLAKLHAAGLIFPCEHSRRDVREAAGAPHEDDDEPIYPKAFRPPADAPLPPLSNVITTNWRFRVPDGETLTFADGHAGVQSAVAGRDFGDFLVWRKDNLPSYQLACVADDIAMASPKWCAAPISSVQPFASCCFFARWGGLRRRSGTAICCATNRADAWPSATTRSVCTPCGIRA